MTTRRPRRLSALPRAAYHRARALTGTPTENRVEPRIRFAHDAPALLLSPHWDDAVLSCWGLLIGARELEVINVFGGMPGEEHAASAWEAVIGVNDPAERARARVAEDEHALARAGRKPVNLPLLDARHRPRDSQPFHLDTLDRALTGEVPLASHIYAPAGIGGHPDHLHVRRYARMLLRVGIPVSLYAELPYCTFHGWPAWVDGGQGPPKGDVDAYWQSFLAAVPEMPALRSAVVERLDGTDAERKREALLGYEASLNYAVRRMLADPEFHAFEVRWELVKPGGEAVSAAGAVTELAGR